MIDIDSITREAVLAALRAIDERIPDSGKSVGPLGDSLAGELHRIIELAIKAHVATAKGN